MKTLLQYKNEQIKLEQPSIWKRVYHLQAGNDVLMTMRYPKWYSAEPVVEGFGETWEFRKPSFWRSALEIKKQHNQLPFAKYVPEGWKGSGAFELPNGDRIAYRFDFWKNANELYSQQQVRLATFKRESLFKGSIIVTLEHESALLEKNPWILMVIYHFILERRQRANGAG
jgi:hypothetical protein